MRGALAIVFAMLLAGLLQAQNPRGTLELCAVPCGMGDGLLGELFDYVNRVCDPLHPFAPGVCETTAPRARTSLMV